uniref:Disease resistance protein winged helix domain-containing protein n=1 Tax=Oryza brachyantha TaxID=4533 RepID=J3LSH5_ORYBR
MEEVAEGYIKELIHINMLQLVERNSFGRIKSFRMHDIVRQLAVDLCRSDCFGIAYNDEDKHGESIQGRDGRRMLLLISSLHRLRSMIALDKSSSRILSMIMDNSRYMSVLELSGLPIDKVPDAIGDLFNLRHLGLRDSKASTAWEIDTSRHAAWYHSNTSGLESLVLYIATLVPVGRRSAAIALSVAEPDRNKVGQSIIYPGSEDHGRMTIGSLLPTRWFPNLRELHLRGMPNLKQVEIHHGAMTSMQELVLVHFSGMVKVPSGIEYAVPALKWLAGLPGDHPGLS